MPHVSSFTYLCRESQIEGELVLSAEMARRRAGEVGWRPIDEMTLYVVHAVLHITGMDDHEDDDRARMRQAEKEVMLRLGIHQINRCAADVAESGAVDRPAAVEDGR